MYLPLLYEMGVLCSTGSPHARPLYVVAIDCPGYGQSEGAHQIVRTYPAQYLKAAINALGMWVGRRLLPCAYEGI